MARWMDGTHLLIFRHCSVVDQGMVVKKEPACDVESNKDIDAVMLVGCEDEKDAEAVEQPSEGVEKVDSAARVLRDEEVQQGERDSVSREHVVSAGPRFSFKTKCCLTG